MSSEIWKIGQEINAQTMYKNVEEFSNIRCGLFRIRNEVMAVQHLTNMCNAMNEAYDEIIDDQNEYLIEIENEATDLNNLKNDIDEKLKVLYTEIKELEKKEQNGTITEEEQTELDAKRDELKTFMKESDNKIQEKTDSINSKDSEKIKEHKSKEAIAKDYGETTVEKGTPLAETKVSHGFFKKLFGTTGKDKKEVGERAVEAGNKLLNKVESSADMNEKIDKTSKLLKQK